MADQSEVVPASAPRSVLAPEEVAGKVAAQMRRDADIEQCELNARLSAPRSQSTLDDDDTVREQLKVVVDSTLRASGFDPIAITNSELYADFASLALRAYRLGQLQADPIAASPEGWQPTKEKTVMEPTTGRIVLYRLSAADVEAMTRRRTNGGSIAERMKADPPQWPAGAQAHIGNPLSVGDVVPMLIVRVWPNEFGEGIHGVNGQAVLDGNDTLWVTSAKEGTEPGTWAWPTRN